MHLKGMEIGGKGQSVCTGARATERERGWPGWAPQGLWSNLSSYRGKLRLPGIRAGRPAAPGSPPEVSHTGWDPTSGQRSSSHPYPLLSSKPPGDDRWSPEVLLHAAQKRGRRHHKALQPPEGTCPGAHYVEASGKRHQLRELRPGADTRGSRQPAGPQAAATPYRCCHCQ